MSGSMDEIETVILSDVDQMEIRYLTDESEI